MTEIQGMKAIHPYDVYDVICDDPKRFKDTGEFVTENVNGYPINYHVILIDGERMVETSACDFSSKTFVEKEG